MKKRTEALLWFLAAALSATAAAIRYFSGEEVRWPLFAAAVFLAIMGFRTFQQTPRA
jgi:hypothetical protein